MVSTTKTPAQVYPDGTPIAKTDVRLMVSEMLAGTNADLINANSRMGKIYGSRADAVALLQAQPPATGVNLIVTVEGSALVVRFRTNGVTDPLFASGDRWGEALRFDRAELATLSTERVNATRDTGVLPLVSVGGTNAIVADLSAGSGVTTLSASSTVDLIPAVTNTGMVTLNVGGTGAWPVQRRNGSPVAASDLKAGHSYLLRRMGNAWRLIGFVDSDVQARVDIEAAARQAADAAEATARQAADAERVPGRASPARGDAVLAFTTDGDGSRIFGVDSSVGGLSAHVGADKLATNVELDAADAALRADMADGDATLLSEITARGEVVLGGRLSPDFVWALTTVKDGSVMLGVRTDGTLAYDSRVAGVDAAVSDGVAHAVKPDDTLVQATRHDLTPRMLSDLEVADARIDGGYLRVVEKAQPLWWKYRNGDAAQLIVPAGRPDVRRIAIPRAPFVSTGVQKLRALIVYGQSLADGTSPRLTTAPVAPGRALMFVASPEAPKLPTHGISNVPNDWRGIAADKGFERSLDRIGDLYEADKETPTSGMAAMMVGAGGCIGPDQALMAINLANGGVDYKNLTWAVHQNLDLADPTDPGNVSQWNGFRFEQIMRALKVLRFQCDYLGLELDVCGVTMIHGEADVGIGAGYKGYMEHFQPGLADRVRRITGQATDVPLFLDQAAYRGATSLAQLQAALDNPLIFCGGAKYHIPRISFGTGDPEADGVHPNAEGRRTLGYYYGRMIRSVMNTGDFIPLHVQSATRTGASIVLDFTGNDGPLVFDETLVWPVANKGIIWEQTGGASATILSVAITGAAQITVTLSADPGAGTTAESIGIATNEAEIYAQYGPDYGPRSNIRDSSTDTGATGEPLFKWACHQKITLK